jgi:hypothetical protein
MSRRLLILISIVALACHSGVTVSRDYYLRPFSDESPWNKALINYDGHPDRPTIISRKLRGLTKVVINSKKWSIPFYRSSKNDQSIKIKIKNINESIDIKLPYNAKPADGSDAHLSILMPDNIIYEFYKFNLEKREAKSLHTIKADGLGVSADPGKINGSRAYGGSSVGGLIRSWELCDGVEIKHALAVSLGGLFLKQGYVWPATSQDKHSKMTYSGSIPMGSIVVLPNEVDIDLYLSNPLAKKIALAFQKYGAYIVDSTNSKNLVLYAEPMTNNIKLRDAASDLSLIIDKLVVLDGYSELLKNEQTSKDE